MTELFCNDIYITVTILIKNRIVENFVEYFLLFKVNLLFVNSFIAVELGTPQTGVIISLTPVNAFLQILDQQ